MVVSQLDMEEGIDSSPVRGGIEIASLNEAGTQAESSANKESGQTHDDSQEKKPSQTAQPANQQSKAQEKPNQKGRKEANRV